MQEYTPIKDLAKGDERALKWFYEHIGDAVFNIAISYTKNQEDAEEILQDVFVTLYQQAADFQYNSKVSTWIYRITVNKCLDYLRKKNSQKRFGKLVSLFSQDTGELVFQSVDFVHPGIKLEQQEHAKMIFAVLDELPEKQQTAFILTHIEDLSQAETAEIMEVTRKAVESLVQRAKANMRKKLEKFYPERGM